MKTACGVSRARAARVEGEMSDKIYDVPVDWTKRAWVDQAKYKEMYARLAQSAGTS